MAEESKPKFVNLPGIDTAPDVYETPDLAEDVSTIQASTAVSESEYDDSDPERDGLHRQRLQTADARSRFQPARIDARGVDFSDNVAQRQSYRASTRARRRRGEILGYDSDEERESFSDKLARVKQELHELEREFEKRVETGDDTKIEEQDPKAAIEFISDKLDFIYARRRGGARGVEAQHDRMVQKFDKYKPFGPSVRITKAIASQPPLPGSQVQKSQLDYVMDQAAAFDQRIKQLEDNLGLNGNRMPEISNHSTFPVFTTLQQLEMNIAVIGDASTNNLDSAAQHIKRLIADAEQLKEMKQDTSGSNSVYSEDQAVMSADQEAKINALYGTIPTIDKLAPVLPLVLERLRTLRLVHTSAWQAEEVLTELEKRQSGLEDEIKNWEKNLKNVESQMKVCEQQSTNNMSVVSADIRTLEEKVARLVAEGME